MRPARLLHPLANSGRGLLASALLLACKDPPAAPERAPDARAAAMPAASGSATSASSASGRAPAAKPPTCSADGWCELLDMQKGSLHAIWGTHSSNVYALWGGVLVHSNGVEWSTVSGFEKGGLWAISGSDAANVWVVGDAGAVSHFDGQWKASPSNASTWPNRASHALRAVHARTTSDVWVVGDAGAAAHWDGHAWKARDLPESAHHPDLLGVWASAADDVWAVGTLGTLAHWDGKDWAIEHAKSQAALGSITGTLSEVDREQSGQAPQVRELWAVGQAGTIVHYDGHGWTADESATKKDLFAVWAENHGDAWAVGEAGTILHWDGTAWSSSPSGTTSDLHGIWGPIARDLWVVGFSRDHETKLLRRHR